MKTYKFKMFNSKQNKHLNKQINIFGNIWNHCISLCKRYYKLTGKTINFYQLQNHIVKLKKLKKYSFWNEVGSQAIQDVVQRIEKSYKRFFKNVKLGVKCSPPTFKKICKYKSFTLKQNCGWKLLDGNKVKIQKKVYKYFKSREIVGNIKTVTIKRDNLGNFWILFVTDEIRIPEFSMTGKRAGIDFGVKTFLTLSNNTEVKSPLFFSKAFKKLAKVQRQLSKVKKYSIAWLGLKKTVGKIYLKVSNQRRDYFYKLSRELVKEFDLLCFETLDIKEMLKENGKKVGDISFPTFLEILQDVAKDNNKVVVKIDKWYPSSKTCNICGNVNKELKRSERVWQCKSCKAILERDFNASLNILKVGVSAFEKTLETSKKRLKL